MARKSKERTRLLKLYERTGDEEYRRAAECLNIPIREWLEQLQLKPGRRGKTVGKTAHPRLYRMARMIRGGVTVYAAARREVTEHGIGSHASKEAAIDYLRSQYADNREAIEVDLVEMERLLANQRGEMERLLANQRGEMERLSASQRWFMAEAEAAVRQASTYGHEMTKIARVAQQSMPPVWAHTAQHHVLSSWIRDIGVITRGIGRQMIGWRNTRPKSVEKRSNDKGASM